MFFLGTAFGAAGGTLTTIAVTMSIYGVNEAIASYNQALCGG